MKNKNLSWIVTAINLLFILIFFSVPLWGFWENTFRFFVWEIPLWYLLYFLMLFIVIGFLVYILNKIISFRRVEKLLWFFREIPEKIEEIVVVNQVIGEKKVIYVNDSAERFYDIQRNDVINKEKWSDFVMRKPNIEFESYPLEMDGKHIFTINVAPQPNE